MYYIFITLFIFFFHLSKVQKTFLTSLKFFGIIYAMKIKQCSYIKISIIQTVHYKKNHFILEIIYKDKHKFYLMILYII